MEHDTEQAIYLSAIEAKQAGRLTVILLFAFSIVAIFLGVLVHSCGR